MTDDGLRRIIDPRVALSHEINLRYRKTHGSLTSAVVLCLISIFIFAFSTTSALAGHTHFRFGHYTWRQAGDTTIDATLQNAWRRDGYGCVDVATLNFVPCSPGDGLPQVGDVIEEFIGFTQFNWGDGSPPVGSPLGPLLYLVTSIDPDNNWLFGLALDPDSLPAIDTTLSHTYAMPGDYVAFTDSCCRISAAFFPNEHINNPDGGYRVETIINVDTPNSSPVSALPPIVRCPIDALCTFKIPASDPDGDIVSFRLSSSAEAATFTGFVQPGPPDAPNAATIDNASGLYSWDTTGATLAANPFNNTLYSTQVTIEDDISKVALDFLIELVEQDPNPPVIEPPLGSPPICETTQVTTVGSTKTFDVTASDPDFGDLVTLNAVGLPLGATMTPSLPLVGNPVESAFSWTPTNDQIGTHIVNFVSDSTGGGSALCPVIIEVIEACAPPEDILVVHDWGVDAIVTDQEIIGDMLEANVQIANERKYWLGVRTISSSPHGSAVLNPGLGLGGFFARHGLIPPSRAAMWIATFCEPGTATVVLARTPLSEAITVLDLLFGTLIDFPHSLDAAVGLARELDQIPKWREAMECLAGFRDASPGERMQMLRCAWTRLREMINDPEQRDAYHAAFIKFNFMITIESLVNAVFRGLPNLIATTGDHIQFLVRTGGTSSVQVDFVGR